ncbi:uncharacterized protein BDR25DRAFT_341738 [Lindgomyces ingoldianus]|uniref:Uncharacterized protein n=1 Tax=Lindgomyces ingoldianus TaxID=673940 RepID=A0ACB6R3R8_9PLEO|nr:uncharacterized protein BDR25DRAFT_341738 [Lindgomyces ingoldianus]KAF2472970.1 hypothetical protein BDR25DRAFT_341738 [Lindgomyces ingoldianus]
MSSYSPRSPFGLPQSPRPNGMLSPGMLSPINTTLSSPSSPRYDSGATSPTNQALSEKGPQPIFIDTRQRRRESMIFVNATIPLSPRSSIALGDRSDTQSLREPPRKRRGIARLFCCFSSEARERRKRQRYMDFERMEDVHWTEL